MQSVKIEWKLIKEIRDRLNALDRTVGYIDETTAIVFRELEAAVKAVEDKFKDEAKKACPHCDGKSYCSGS